MGPISGMRQFITLIALLLLLAVAALFPGCNAGDRTFDLNDEGDRIGDTAPGQDNRSHARGW